MYLITQAWYPLKVGPQVAQRFMEVLQKYSPDESVGKMIFSATKPTRKGVHVISARECQEGMMEEAINKLNKAQHEFADIEGYEFTIDVYLSMTESFASIGMQAPE